MDDEAAVYPKTRSTPPPGGNDSISPRVVRSVSLIVTTYNWPQALALTFASIEGQSQLPDEIIVADDGSGTDTAQVVAEWKQRLRCMVRHSWQQDEGYRLSRSRNRAIALSKGDYLVLVDGDMILHSRFIEDHVRCARADCFIQGARPRLSQSLTARLLNGERAHLSVFTPGIEHRAYALRNPLLSHLTSRARFSLGGIQGCNQSFWREHVTQVNGYDERFEGWGPEDREFATRLMHLGLKRNYIRHRAIAFHLYHSSRAPTGDNPYDALLQETQQNRSTRCARGLDGHA